MRAALAAQRAKQITFSDAAEQYLKIKTTEFKNAKHAAQWSSTLKRYAYPHIGNMPIGEIGLAHILLVLEPIWISKTETASRLRQRIEAVMTWATVSGYRQGDNPALWRGNLDAILPKPTKLKKVQHFKAIPWRQAGDFYKRLNELKGTGAMALKFTLLTAARSGEIRGAIWDEINLQERTWRIPAERMKAEREHVIPLNDDAVELLRNLIPHSESNYVFAGARGGMLSDVAVNKAMRQLSPDATVHGLRSTFRDWCAETTNYPREVAEMALAHTITNAVERAYRRGDLFEKRVRLMNDWCSYLNQHPE